MPSFLNLRGNNNDSKDPRLIREGIKLGVNYKRFSKDPVLGKNILLRSNTVIYNDVIIGDDFKTGHNVVVRDHTTIGNDVLIGTETVSLRTMYSLDLVPALPMTDILSELNMI